VNFIEPDMMGVKERKEVPQTIQKRYDTLHSAQQPALLLKPNQLSWKNVSLSILCVDFCQFSKQEVQRYFSSLERVCQFKEDYPFLFCSFLITILFCFRLD
jgi:hypothetical protein